MLGITPEQLYVAFAQALEDICGGHSATRTEPITREEWADLRLRFDLLQSVNQPKEEEICR